GAGDGATPIGGLLVANLSSFYGTTTRGGSFSGGTLFQIDSFGTTTILHAFGAVGDGSNPGPLLAVGGHLLGTTQGGGVDGSGTISVYGPESSTSVLSVAPTAGPVRVTPGDPVQIEGGNFPVGAPVSVTIGGLPATGVQVVDSQTIIAISPPGLEPGSLNDVVVTTSRGTPGILEAAWMADFLDVTGADRLHPFVERVFADRIMDGCGGGNFCE